MTWKVLMAIGAGLCLSGLGARAADSVRAFGLEFTVISNAVMVIDSESAALRVLQVGGPDCEDGGGGSNDVVNVPFGISVHLGEAQSGVYIYPDADCVMDGRSMWGRAYGHVNGETNRLISFMKGTRVEWGEYRVEVDFSALGADSYSYEVWSHGIRTLRQTTKGRSIAISTYRIEDHNPRVNPFFQTEAGPGAVIEFPNGTLFNVEGAEAAGDRMIVTARGATNQVNYLSRVDVFGSANLPAFAVNDARIGMFGRPHKALGAVNFAASNGRLTAGPFDGDRTEQPTNGILVDFKYGAVRWLTQTEPFALHAPEAALLLSASGLASLRGSYYSYWGPVGLTKSNGVISVMAGPSLTSNSLLRVFRENILSGIIRGPSGTALASLAETNPLVIGWAVTVSGLSLSIAEPTTVTGHDGTVLEGDRLELAPHDGTVRIGYAYSAHVFAHGIPEFTIVSELTEEARVPEARLQIERVPPHLVVSWPYHRNFYLVVRTDLTRWNAVGYPSPEYRDFRWYLTVNPTNVMRFYSVHLSP
jgi:hypothetical protein